MTNNFNLSFLFCYTFIALVSSIDTSLTVLCAEELISCEENPIARAILQMDNWQVFKFVGIKMFFTIVVLNVLCFLQIKGSKYSSPVVKSLALFQAFLLLYLFIN